MHMLLTAALPFNNAPLLTVQPLASAATVHPSIPPAPAPAPTPLGKKMRLPTVTDMEQMNPRLPQDSSRQCGTPNIFQHGLTEDYHAPSTLVAPNMSRGEFHVPLIVLPLINLFFPAVISLSSSDSEDEYPDAIGTSQQFNVNLWYSLVLEQSYLLTITTNQGHGEHTLLLVLVLPSRFSHLARIYLVKHMSTNDF